MRKEYKRVVRHVHISPDERYSYDMNMNIFLANHPNLKIEHTIVHKPYHVSIIYSELEEI